MAATGFKPSQAMPPAKRDGVLLGDADIEGALRKLFQNLVDARPVRHRRRQRDDLFILRHQLAHRLAEDGRVGRRASMQT